MTATTPLCHPLPKGAGWVLKGVVGAWLDTVVENWLLPFSRQARRCPILPTNSQAELIGVAKAQGITRRTVRRN